MIIRTYGERINSLKPKYRELYIESDTDLEGTIKTLVEAWKTLNSWKVSVPNRTPWYHVKPCLYCFEIVRKRFKKYGTMFNDWWFQHCKRHATAEFLSQISVIDNKERVFTIDLEKRKIVVEVTTNKHQAKYIINRNSISAIFDGTTFTYKPHINSYPFAPAYNIIINYACELIDELINIVQNPHELEYQVNVYFNDQLIYEVK